MKSHQLAFLCLALSSAVCAAPPAVWPEINSSGRILKNAKVMKVKPNGLQILHDAGMETVPWVYRCGSGDGEREALILRQMGYEPLPASRWFSFRALPPPKIIR